jgi:hypothetical protein
VLLLSNFEYSGNISARNGLLDSDSSRHPRARAIATVDSCGNSCMINSIIDVLE